MSPLSFHFEQLFRTPHSEQWSALVEGAASPMGRVDVHFERSAARVTVTLREDVDDATAEAVLARVDEQLIPAGARGDVRITLWRGRHEGTFAPE